MTVSYINNNPTKLQQIPQKSAVKPYVPNFQGSNDNPEKSNDKNSSQNKTLLTLGGIALIAGLAFIFKKNISKLLSTNKKTTENVAGAAKHPPEDEANIHAKPTKKTVILSQEAQATVDEYVLKAKNYEYDKKKGTRPERWKKSAVQTGILYAGIASMLTLSTKLSFLHLPVTIPLGLISGILIAGIILGSLSEVIITRKYCRYSVNKKICNLLIKELEKKGLSREEIQVAVEDYLKKLGNWHGPIFMRQKHAEQLVSNYYLD